MPHGGGYRKPLVHPGLTREASFSGVWLVASGEQSSFDSLLTRHSSLATFLVLFRHGAGHVDHGQYHEDEGLEKARKDGQSHNGQWQDERQ